MFFSGALRDESPKYVQMIEERDNISELSIWQKYLLCTNIVLSPNYEENRRKFRLNWIKYNRMAETNIHLYRRKCLSFVNDEYNKESWCAECLYCNSQQKDPPAHPTNLILTRAYNDKHSLYVLVEKDGKIHLKDYAKNVAILMNARVPFTNDAKYIHPENNYSEEELED